jgi:hypothetical protein
MYKSPPVHLVRETIFCSAPEFRFQQLRKPFPFRPENQNNQKHLHKERLFFLNFILKEIFNCLPN